jgi:hypothetical protein
MIFDDEKVPYTLIMDGDVKRGALKERFDLILFPNTDEDLKGIIEGIDTRFSPLPFTQTKDYPSHGSPTSSPDITGGLTFEGVQHLSDFVRQGGVLVTLGGASTLPLDAGIVRDARHAKTKDLQTPGSEIRARFARPSHPLAYGYSTDVVAFRENRTLYTVRRADEGAVVLTWGRHPFLPEGDEDENSDEKKDDLVVSGGVKGGRELEGKPAILDFPVGRGRVIAFDFDPIHRYTTVSTFRMVWNAILNWNHLPPKTPASR